MAWLAPTYTGGVVWEDAPSVHTPLNAAELNLQENALATFSATVGQSVVNYFEGGSSPELTRRWVSPVGDYTLAATDGGALVTVTSMISLPGSPIPGAFYGVKVLAAGVTLTVSTGSAGVIDAGTSSMQITQSGASVSFTVAPNASDWLIVASYGPLSIAPVPIPPPPIVS